MGGMSGLDRRGPFIDLAEKIWEKVCSLMQSFPIFPILY